MKMLSTIFKVLAVLAIVPNIAVAREAITVTDIAGREVRVQVPVDHVILGEGRYMPALAILDRDNPIKRVSGMVGDFEKYDPAGYAQFRKHFPAIDDIPRIGGGNAGSFSLEKALSVKPDVAIFGLMSGHGPSAKSKEILDMFAAADIPVVTIDFRIDPLVNTPKSLALLGRLFGRDRQATEFLTYYGEQLALVQDRLATVEQKPTVFLESRVGLRNDCCEAMGDKMMAGSLPWQGGGTSLPKPSPARMASSVWSIFWSISLTSIWRLPSGRLRGTAMPLNLSRWGLEPMRRWHVTVCGMPSRAREFPNCVRSNRGVPMRSGITFTTRR